MVYTLIAINMTAYLHKISSLMKAQTFPVLQKLIRGVRLTGNDCKYEGGAVDDQLEVVTA